MNFRLVSKSRIWWALAFTVILSVPIALCLTIGRSMCGAIIQRLSIDTGLVAFSLLVLTLLLIARIPSLVAALGIEKLLRAHRLIAVSAVVLVVAHVVLVLISDPRHFAIFNIAHTTRAARAAITSTVALAGVVGLAMRRRRRQPRYEGWRLLHVLLAFTVFGGAWLHVWWLRHLTSLALFAGWFAIMAAVVAAIVVRRWVWLPMRSHRRPYVVENVTPVAGDAVTVALSARGHKGIPFRAGQFAWLKVGHSPFVFEEHPFSIASTAHTPHVKEFTIKALGDFSELLAGLRPGRHVYVDGAYGALTTHGRDHAPGFAFIAGGIGVTPMLSMIRTLADHEDDRAHMLIMGARTPADLLLRQEIGLLQERLDLTVVDVVEQPPEKWLGEAGRIDMALLDRSLPLRSRRHMEYFVCGPPMMVIGVSQQLRSLGISPRRIHTERFEVV
jgi:predicted ferric reductase